MSYYKVLAAIPQIWKILLKSGDSTKPARESTYLSLTENDNFSLAVYWGLNTYDPL